MSRKKWTSEKIVTRLLNNKTQKTFWENIHELRRRPNKEVYNRAFKLADSESEKEKIIGIYVLAQLGFEPRFQQSKTIKLYFKLLENEKSPKVISAILSSISHNNEKLNEKQILKLLKYKTHKFVDVRFQLTLAISCLKNEVAIENLIELSTDKNADIRNWATFGLGTQIEIDNSQIRNALWERVNDTDASTREEAIFGLAKRKEVKIKEILIKELKKIDEFGSLILEAIEEFKDKDFIKLIEKQISENEKTKTVNEEWLTNTLEKLKALK
jgi:HEAT repeat protein